MSGAEKAKCSTQNVRGKKTIENPLKRRRNVKNTDKKQNK